MFKQIGTNRKIFIRLSVSTILIAIFCVCIFFHIKNRIDSSKFQAEEMAYSNAISMIQNEDITEITFFTDNSEKVILKDETGNEYEVKIFNQGIFHEFVQEEIENGQKIKINNLNIKYTLLDFLIDIIYTSATVATFFLIIDVYNLICSIRGNKKQSNKNNEIQNEQNNTEINEDNIQQAKIEQTKNNLKSNVKFCDVAGLDEEKFELEEVVDFLKNPKKYQDMGAKIPKGILLSGSPGTGKTLLAKALAGEAGVALLHASGSEFVEKYVGVGAKRIRNLFEQARELAPCIIFIDEIDAIGSKRSDDSNNVEHNQTLEQLLIEMDGFDSSTVEGIIVIAATNRADSLDKALLRPGRFDRHIIVRLPDVKGREEILKIHSRNKKFDDSVDFKKIAHNTSGFSGAQLENLLNEASIMAVRNIHEKISESDINSALKKIVVGLSKTGKILSEKERLLTAYHESGHAIVSLFTNNQNSIKEISIIGAGEVGGYTWYENIEDKNYISKTELQGEVISLLGGRAAERIFFQDISTGASNDLKKATDIVIRMLIFYGMDETIGPISMNGDYSEYLDSSQFSFVLMQRTKEILCNAEKQATRILQQHKPFVEELVKTLLEKETVHGEELDQIMFRAFQDTYAAKSDDV